MDFFALLQESPPFLLLTVTVVGLCVGSFLNVVIVRLPVMMEAEWQQQCRELLDLPGENNGNEAGHPPAKFNLVHPGSHCPKCRAPIKAIHNIPVLSYFLLKGRCAACQTEISLRYPLIELITAVVSFIVAWRFGFSWAGLGGLFLSWALIALTMIDFDHQLLPDAITLPFLWLGILFNMNGVYTDLSASVIGAVAGYLSLWSIYMIFKLVTGKEGMGYGDFKLFALLGAWLGWQALPGIILLSSLVGAVVGISLILFRGRDRNIPIPFGPYLATAGWIFLVWGGEITTSYWRLIGL